MKKRAQGFSTAAQDSNPGSPSREYEALPLGHCVLFTLKQMATPTGHEHEERSDVQNDFGLFEAADAASYKREDRQHQSQDEGSEMATHQICKETCTVI